MPLAVTYHADLGPAAAAFAVLAATSGAAAEVEVDVTGLDPFTAAFGGAVEAVAGHVFFVLDVPLFLEFGVEEFVDVFEGDVFGCAASGRHVLGVRDGHGEYAF